MKLTVQAMRSRARRPLHNVEYLDLSQFELETYDKLLACTKLKHLSLRGNSISYLTNFDCCPQLWKLDLCNNQIQNLEGLTRFVALGVLLLANNQITWSELSKLRHMHILELSLHGNPQLEKDSYYRMHVIDCLPNVWMLDGRIVTSAERIQVEHFFAESELSERPVRHKLPHGVHFTPSHRQKVQVTGVFGDKANHLFSRFSTNGALNVDTDRRRTQYLAYNLQQDLLLDSRYINNRNVSSLKNNRDCLEDLIKDRNHDRTRCNMLLLLLVSSLDFAIPSHLMHEALRCTKLNVIVNVSTMELFLLPKEHRCRLVSLLLSAAKVDKDMGEDGGLYDKLYLCLYNTVSELTRLSQGGGRTTVESQISVNMSQDSKSLVAAEVVQLMCIVPAFFEYVTKDAGVMNVVSCATADINIIDKLNKLMRKMQNEKYEAKAVYEHVAESILHAIHQVTVETYTSTKHSVSPTDKYALNIKTAIPKRPHSAVVSSSFHTRGKTSPHKTYCRIKTGKQEQRAFFPTATLGERVLLGPQTTAKVISIPEPDVVLVELPSVADETGAMIQNRKDPEDHYRYLDMNDLFWDNLNSYWKPRGTTGDRITLQSPPIAEIRYEAQKLTDKDIPQPPPVTPTPRSASTSMIGGTPRISTPNTMLIHNSPPMRKVDIPQGVSARYKEERQLRLAIDDDAFMTALVQEAHASRATNTPCSTRRQTEDEANQQNVLSDEPVNHIDGGTIDGEQATLAGEASDIPVPIDDLTGSLDTDLEDAGQSQPNTRPGTAHSSRAASLTRTLLLAPAKSATQPDSAKHTESNPSTAGGTAASSHPVQGTTRPVSAASRPMSAASRPMSAATRPMSAATRPVSAASRPGSAATRPMSAASRPGSAAARSTSHDVEEPNDDILPDTATSSTPLPVAAATSASRPKTPGTPDCPIDIPTMELSESARSVDLSRKSTQDNVAAPQTIPEQSAAHIGATSEPVQNGIDHTIENGHQADSNLERDNTTLSKTRPSPPAKEFKFHGGRASPLSWRGTFAASVTQPDMVSCNNLRSSSYVTPYQKERVDVIKKDSQRRRSSAKQAAPNELVDDDKPMSRPPSPFGRRTGKKPNISIQRGEAWLGGGRDLHWEKFCTRPHSASPPGWKVGLPARPKSAAAARALRRSRPPSIVTPSSLAYDQAVARPQYGPVAATTYMVVTENAYPPSPVFHPLRRPRQQESVPFVDPRYPGIGGIPTIPFEQSIEDIYDRHRTSPVNEFAPLPTHMTQMPVGTNMQQPVREMDPRRTWVPEELVIATKYYKQERTGPLYGVQVMGRKIQHGAVQVRG